MSVAGGRSNTVSSAVEKSAVDKSNDKGLIQSTLYDQQTPYAGWKLYFPDQCTFVNTDNYCSYETLQCNSFCILVAVVIYMPVILY